MGILLLALSVLPVILLMIFIYRQDKYEKEPLGLLIRAFIGGMLAIPLDILIVSGIDSIFEGTAFTSTVFFSAFIEAGIPEELCKFIIFMIFIWRNKNFNEYFDGIIYATFIGLGFACVENIEYVFMFGIQTGIVRALLSVPGHFLFGVVMGYFLSLAKFHPEKRGTYLITGLLLAMLIHGLFDWLLMVTEHIPESLSFIIFGLFLWGDIKLWKIGLKYIHRHQEKSQFKEPVYKQIDWNAGDK